jgi:hypothetical protein
VTAAAVAIAALAYFIYLLDHKDAIRPDLAKGPLYSVVRLSIAAVLLYLFFGLKVLLNNQDLFAPRHLWKRVWSWRCLGVVAFLGLVKGLAWLLSNGDHLMGFPEALAAIGFTSIAKPAAFVVNHVLFFGPVLLFALLLWRPICRHVHEQGVGLTLAVAAGLILALADESRFLFGFIPLLVPFVAKATEAVVIRPGKVWAVVGLSLLFSKVWLSLNDSAVPLDSPYYPNYWYCATVGVFMPLEAYLGQGLLIVLTGWLFYTFCRQPKASSYSTRHPELRRRKRVKRQVGWGL